ncbi:hypothetical protein [Treponema bryantii]|uniref:hypothetical protein n=1 Tax=Treponema bryantii TaxID=163 RepID=UPI002B2BEE96|nr:hypothetical protein TRBR_25650 [Treponema bryantii]
MKIRKISVLLFVLSVFLFAACDGISTSPVKKDEAQLGRYPVRGSVRLQKKAKTVNRAAYPSFEINEDINWTITAVCEDESVPSVIVENGSEENFEAILTAEGKWAFSAVGKIGDNVILQSHLPVEIEVAEQEEGVEIEPVQISLNVYPVFSNDFTGSISLSFYDDTMEYEDQITEIRYSFADEAIEGGSITFNNQKTAVLSLNNIPAGAYTVTFDVYREQNDKLYSLTEVINVFSGFVTDVWQTTGDNTFILTDELFFDFDEQEFPSDLEYPIVLWNLWTESEYEWSSSTGYGVFSEISEKAKLEDGIRFGKDINSFCFDAKNNKIYSTETIDNQKFLFSYPSYTGYTNGKHIPMDASEYPACVYDGNVWFVSKKDGKYHILKLKDGELRDYTLFNSENAAIEFSSNIYDSIKLSADSEYLYVLGTVPEKSQRESGGFTVNYISEYTFTLMKFAISGSDEKLTLLSECSVYATEDFGIPVTNEALGVSSGFMVSDFVLFEESEDITVLYALLLDKNSDGSPVKGGIAKFESTVSGNQHNMLYKPIDESPDAPKLFGWFYSYYDSDSISELAQEIDYDLGNRLRNYSSSNPFALKDLPLLDAGEFSSEAEAQINEINEILEPIRTEANSPRTLYGPQKIIARKPDELIIADEGAYGYSENTNRVYSLNLRTLSVTTTNVNVSFNGYMDSGYHSF